MQKQLRRYSGIKFRTGENAKDKYGLFVCQIYFNPYPNKRVYKTIKLEKKSFQEATRVRIQWMAEFMQNHPHLELTDKCRLSFSALKEILIQMMRAGTFTNRAGGCSQRTINKSLNVFCRFFEKFIPQRYSSLKRLNDLPKGIFLDYQAFIAENKLVWRNEIQALKTIISRFWKADYCDDRIYKEIRKIPTPDAEQKKRQILTLKEKKMLLDFIRTDKLNYYFITYFLAKLGWRINETLSIKRRNIEWVKGDPASINIEKEFRKNRKEFVLETVDKNLANIIREAFDLTRNTPTEFLFPNSKGNMIKDDLYRRYICKLSMRLLRRKITPHDFRHSAVTHFKGLGYSDKDIMAITGHVDREVLNKYYSHSTEDGRRKVLEAAGL